MKNLGQLWVEFNENEELARAQYKVQQIRKDFLNTIVGGFITQVDLFISMMNDTLGSKEALKEAYHLLRARQIYKMLGSLIRYGDGMIYSPEQKGCLIFDLCNRYFLTSTNKEQHISSHMLINVAREIIRRSKYAILSRLAHSHTASHFT